MAKSPSHRLGQIVGNVLEAAVEPLLQEIADQHKLYLDSPGYRPARGSKKVSWVGNSDVIRGNFRERQDAVVFLKAIV